MSGFEVAGGHERLAGLDCYVVAARGELDLAVAPQLERTLGAAEGEQALILDLTGLSFIDSSGLRVLATAARHNGARSPALAVVAPPGSEVSRLLELSGLAGRIPLHAGRDEALAALRKGGGEPR